VAKALGVRPRDTDILGRLGGDEFGILLPHTTPEAAMVAEALLEALHTDAHVRVGERDVRVTASIGVRTMAVEQTANGERILAEADIAMYGAKEDGRDRVSSVVGGKHGAAKMRSRLTWSERIRDALDGDGFTLLEQPILNLETGVCDRSEVLVRMIDPTDHSLISPSQFLYIAERFAQTQSIDRWVFSKAIDLLEQRHSTGDQRSQEISLSGASLTDERLTAELTDHVSRAAIDPTKLIVEVTETAAVVNIELARRLASRLSDLGCKFALDDFGSGFGSFFYLKHLHFDEIKIDGEFIKHLAASTVDRLTLEAVVTIAQGMGKRIVAEYVQNEETITLLRGLGVDLRRVTTSPSRLRSPSCRSPEDREELPTRRRHGGPPDRCGDGSGHVGTYWSR
jgi:EAL domain-containing protein (putative c-di-GMP-specific phosphodiesterase class I)